MAKTTDVLTNMWVDKERCLANIHAQGVGHGREGHDRTGRPRCATGRSHEVLREASFTAWPAGKN